MEGKRRARKSKAVAKGNALATRAHAVELATQGVRVDKEYLDLMTALMCDVVQGKVAPQVVNAACNAGARVLQLIELRLRYGYEGTEGRQLLR